MSRAPHENGNQLAPTIKLPTIEIRKFGCQITEFKHVHDTFNILTINNQAPYHVQKLHYLLSSVTNEAHSETSNYTAELSCSLEIAM
jgi:hypothetical protein